MTVVGTERTPSNVRLQSVVRGKADSMCLERVFRLLTRNGYAAFFALRCMKRDQGNDDVAFNVQ
jgi:hypothetical protein